MESLIRQFSDQNYHLVGLQETRSQATGHDSFDRYHILSAAATKKGHGGIQLWIAKRFPTSEHHICIETQHLHILHSTSRRLVIRISHPGLKLIVIVAHAPNEQSADHDDRFWHATNAAIPHCYRTWTTLLLADANARLGQFTSDVVGSHDADEETNNGSALHAWALEQSMFFPQTFQECHSGPSPTWTHPNGAHARIDYVAVSSSVPKSQVCSFVDETIDLSISRLDHQCVAAIIQLPASIVCEQPSSRECFTLPAKSVSAVSQPLWQYDVHTHAALIQNRLLRCQNRLATKLPRKWHMSDTTWQLIQQKTWHFKRVRQLKRTQDLAMLRQMFSAWRSRQTAVDAHSSWLRICDHQIAWHMNCSRNMALQAQKHMRADDKAYYEGLAQAAADSVLEGPQRMWKALKPVLPKALKRRQANLRCVGPSVHQKCQHFCDLEAGTATTYDGLLAQCHLRQNARSEDIPVVIDIDLTQLPSRQDVEKLCRALKSQKAPGIDTVTPDVLKTHLAELSADLCDLFVKSFILGAEPLQFKGGLIHVIGKKHHSTDVKDLRGIMLLDSVAKLFHACVRKHFMQAASRWQQPLQLGGYAKQQTQFATQYLRAFTSLAQHHGVSNAVVFVDLKSAFHHLVRQCIFGSDESDQSRLRQCLEADGFDFSELCSQYDVLSQTFLTDTDVLTKHLLRDAHQSTWFTVSQHDSIYRTERGSRPGSPLADLAFNAMMSHLLKAVQADIDSNPLLQDGFLALGMRAPVVAWVDDVAIPVVTREATDLNVAVVAVMEILLTHCRRRGLTVNFGHNKTECVLMHRGRNAPKERQQHFVEHFGSLRINDQCHMRTVGAYEHLGTAFTQANDLSCEISMRIAKAVAAHRKVARTIFQNRRLSRSTRLQLFESLVVSTLLHGSGSWPVLTPRQFQKLQHRLILWQRSIVGSGFWSVDRMTDRDFQSCWKLAPLALRLAQTRINYGFALCKHGPAVLVDFVSAVDRVKRHDWFDGIRIALRWIKQMDEHACPLDDALSVDSIVQWLTENCHRGPLLVKRLSQRYLLQEHMMWDIRRLHCSLVDTMTQHGVRFHVDAADVLAMHEGGGDHVCYQCSSRFETRKQFASHLWLAHSHVSDERAFVYDSVCRACQKCFWTTTRLQQHLKLSRCNPDGCYAQLTRWCAPTSTLHRVERPEGLKHIQRLPACLVQGPQPERLFLTQGEADDRWTNEWKTFNLPEALPDAILQQTEHAIVSFIQANHERWDDLPVGDLLACFESDEISPMQTQQSLWALCVWCRNVFHGYSHPVCQLEHFHAIHHQLWTLIHEIDIGQLLLWRWRMNAAFVPASDAQVQPRAIKCAECIGDSITRQQEQINTILGRGICFVPECRGIPVITYQAQPTIFIVHMFSGRRRKFDCHWWLQQLAAQYLPGYNVRVLSLDTAVDAELGNLGSGANLDLILKLAASGTFAATISGPPCETFSAARHIQPDDPALRWPRPLRSHSFPWALSRLTCRELRQVHTGSMLMLGNWLVEVSVVLSGGMSLKEHPAPPRDLEKVSIWRNPTHSALLLPLPNAHMHSVEQWRYGSKAIKPTTLRTVNMGSKESVAALLRSTELPAPVKPFLQLSGRDEMGSFRTAAAKEYPKWLSFSIATTTLVSLKRRLTEEGPRFCTKNLSREECDWLESLMCKSDQYLRSTFLPDYQG